MALTMLSRPLLPEINSYNRAHLGTKLTHPHIDTNISIKMSSHVKY